MASDTDGTQGTIKTIPLLGGTLGKGGISINVHLTVTNDVYSVGDVMGGLITFPNAVSGNGHQAVLYSVGLFGVVSLLPELWLFNADIATPAADNAAFALADGDGVKWLGSYPLANGDSVAAQNSFAVVTGYPMIMVKAGAASTSIYAYLKRTTVASPGTTSMYIKADFYYVD